MGALSGEGTGDAVFEVAEPAGGLFLFVIAVHNNLVLKAFLAFGIFRSSPPPDAHLTKTPVPTNVPT